MIRIDCQKKDLGDCMKDRLEKSQVIGRETTVRNDDSLIQVVETKYEKSKQR